MVGLKNTWALALTLLCSTILPVMARFTQAVCAGLDCVEKNSNGTWCYLPQAGEADGATTCTGTAVDLSSVLLAHLAQDLSIAYYNPLDNTRLGGSDYPVSPDVGITRLCLSGKAGDGTVQTRCVNAIGDNSIDAYYYKICEVSLAPAAVIDGCYQGTSGTGATGSPSASTTGNGTSQKSPSSNGGSSGVVSRFSHTVLITFVGLIILILS